MTSLNDNFAGLIAKNVNLPAKYIKELYILESHYYSKNIFEDLGKTLNPTEIDYLKASKNVIATSDIDCVFVCKVLIQNKKHLVVIYDYEELYQPTWIWGVFPRL